MRNPEHDKSAAEQVSDIIYHWALLPQCIPLPYQETTPGTAETKNPGRAMSTMYALMKYQNWWEA